MIAPKPKSAILAEMGELSMTIAPGGGASTATVRVLFFGPVRVQLGISQSELAWAADMTAHELWTELLRHYPDLHSMRATIRLARDGEFLDDLASIQAGDEIALIPPVSGG
jgi:molybdopterin converting factor subunit 1